MLKIIKIQTQILVYAVTVSQLVVLKLIKALTNKVRLCEERTTI
jgi:hypothetical protein